MQPTEVHPLSVGGKAEASVHLASSSVLEPKQQNYSEGKGSRFEAAEETPRSELPRCSRPYRSNVDAEASRVC